MKISTLLIAILGGAFLLLALTNPSTAGFREHIREKQGLAGTLGMAMADLVSGSGKGGVQRDNYVIASRFYTGGDGILPRKDLAWGVAGMFVDAKE